jgi:hypothetical protein
MGLFISRILEAIDALKSKSNMLELLLLSIPLAQNIKLIIIVSKGHSLVYYDRNDK